MTHNMLELLDSIGIDRTSAIAGFVGGLVSMLMGTRKNARETMIYLLIGFFLSGYAGSLIVDQWQWGSSAAGIIGFFLGTIGVQLVSQFRSNSPTIFSTLLSLLKSKVSLNVTTKDTTEPTKEQKNGNS